MNEILNEVRNVQDPAMQKILYALFGVLCIGGYKTIEFIIKRFVVDDADQKKRIAALETANEIFMQRYERDLKDTNKYNSWNETQIKALWREGGKTKYAVQDLRAHFKSRFGVELVGVSWGPENPE